MADIQIRPMEERDLAMVTQIEQETFSQPWSQAGFFDTLALENTIFIVATTNCQIVGYCGMYLCGDEGEITNVVVQKNDRNKGIGQTMLQALIEKAQQRGARTYFLEVRVSNQGAISLYLKFGFVIKGIRKGLYQKPTEDGYIMAFSHQLPLPQRG
jgi:ribosomal-protein-alanine N-acetyltransferase